MSWSRRAALAGCVCLAACGFEPVYGPDGIGTRLTNAVEIAEPKSREAFLLTRDLEQKLGRSTSPSYVLDYTIATGVAGQAVTQVGDITRFSLLGRVDYTLTRMADDVVVADGRVENFAGYSATGSTVDTLSAERDATRRLMAILADQIVTRLYTTTDLDP